MLSLYRGHLFGDAELPAWALPQRDRLRARFVRTVEALGQHFDRGGQAEAAIALYRAALEQDNLAEELYQRLIACHIARGEHAQALNVYRRCRELLSIVLGVSPSVRTETLVARIGGS
jgi:DNA-binding SARP family transcriptional activator